MATRLSDKAYFERQAADSLRADQPMDAGYVWTLLDNIHHLVDEAGKYRVNWMSRHGATFQDDKHYVTLDEDGTWYTIFPTQIVLSDQYPRYDVRVAHLRGFEDMTIRFSLVTPDTWAPIVSDDQQGVIGTWTETYDVSSGPSVISEALIPSKSAEQSSFYAINAPRYPGSDGVVGSIIMAKLIVELLDPEPPSEGGPFIVGVQVREYLR